MAEDQELDYRTIKFPPIGLIVDQFRLCFPPEVLTEDIKFCKLTTTSFHIHGFGTCVHFSVKGSDPFINHQFLSRRCCCPHHSHEAAQDLLDPLNHVMLFITFAGGVQAMYSCRYDPQHPFYFASIFRSVIDHMYRKELDREQLRDIPITCCLVDA